MKYKLKQLSAMSVRSGHGVDTNKKAVLDMGSVCYGDDVWVAEKKETYHNVGDRWFHVTEINGKFYDGWIAIIHLGVKYCDVENSEIVTPTDPITLPASGGKLRDIMISGRIARLRCDWLNPKWGYEPRRVGKMSSNPQTVTFNQNQRKDKGSKIILTSWMKNYLKKINTDRAYNGWLDPKAGWINSGTNPEALSFGGNDVIVKNIDGIYANVHALDYKDESVTDTYFTPNGRLVIHKFDAVTQKCTLIKMGKGDDAYMPFMKNSDSYWIPTAWLEFFPELPFKLSDGRYLAEYLLLGDDTWGITIEGDKVLLFTHKKGYLTNWKMSNPPPPPKA